MSKLLFLLLPIFIFANEIFYDLDKIYLNNRYKSDKFCKRVKSKDTHTFCYKKSIDYILDTNGSGLKGIDKNIESILKEYEELDIKKEVSSIEDEWAGSLWYQNSIIVLYAVTNSTYTIQYDTSRYTGGAHGSYYTSFLNFTKDGKRITLDNLFVPKYQKRLLEIAKKVYLEKFGSMADWFEPQKFVLAENFAITNQGLLFLYNSYEIKSYADGQTQFLLPYSKIEELIAKNSPLRSIKKSTFRYFYEKEVGYIKLKQTPLGSGVKIEVYYESFGNFKQSFLSISFPTLKSKDISKLTRRGFKNLKLYESKSKIYNIRTKKAMSSKYPLLEAWGDITKRAYISFVVNKRSFEMLLRLTQVEYGNLKNYMPSFSKIQDQQEYDVYKINIKE